MQVVDAGLAQTLERLIQREGSPIVFSHGDAWPKNFIIPGGLEKWRRKGGRIAIIDWEYGAWTPPFWDALKAAWLSSSVDEWYRIVKAIFPDYIEELEADSKWKTVVFPASPHRTPTR